VKTYETIATNKAISEFYTKMTVTGTNETISEIRLANLGILAIKDYFCRILGAGFRILK